METNSCHGSVQLVGYLLGEISNEEKILLETHMGACRECQIEIEELQKAWNAIPYELEEIEVPADLKAEVMDAIFPTEKPMIKTEWQRTYGWVAAAVLLFALGGVFWSNLQLREQLQAMENQQKLPTQVLQSFALHPADPVVATAKGSAWLMQQGDSKRLVFNVQGLAKTKGKEAYQVWLIHDGNRKSAGVFLVDDQGNGVLTFDMKEQGIPFEAIGITLEPDSNGQQPRGKKVLGT